MLQSPTVTYLSRKFIVLGLPTKALATVGLVGVFLIPFGAQAKIGLQPGFERTAPAAPEEPPLIPELTPEAIAQQAAWAARRGRNQGFWGAMMNFRKTDSDFRESHATRRQERRAKRLECRTDIRKANRGAMMPITINCYRAVLQTELEMLRKEKQYASGIPGPTEQYRNTAITHIENLSNAISLIIASIDSGYYEDKEMVQGAKKSLGSLYRNNKRLAMTQLRISRSVAWLNHLQIRLDDVRNSTLLPEAVEAKITAAIECLSSQEEEIKALLSLDDNDALIAAFRQEQSDVKFCTESAREAAALNTELEQ
jgi:archaellum component FlaC